MQHFFVTPDQVKEDRIYIEGSDVNHIKNVLRMKIGEQLEINDGNNLKYLGHIEHIQENEIQILIEEKLEADTELPSKIYLFQGLPKADKMELVVQKAVELGATEIIPVETKRAVVKLDHKKKDKKVERWNNIAVSAAKQAARGVIPTVANVMTFKEAIAYAQSMDVRMIPYELAEGMNETKAFIEGIKPGQSIAIFIGPEGGFAKEEVELAIESGAQAITLGKRILRTETAGLTTLSILMYHLEADA
ncbi:MAG: 16S rRNA (uracil(1498)-N(3))-methyltransferase [Eubacteriales bacterium]